MLGLLQTSTVIRFAQLIIANDPKSAIELLDHVYANANSLESFVQTMSIPIPIPIPTPTPQKDESKKHEPKTGAS